MRGAAGVAVGLIVLQVIVAAAMVEMRLPATLRSLHQAVGTALWVAVAALGAIAGKRPRPAPEPEIIHESPSRGEFATPEGVST